VQADLDHSLQYIAWISDNKLAWTLMAPGVGADAAVQISARPIPEEPMVSLSLMMSCSTLIRKQYIIANLGISPNFGDIDFEHLTFPTRLIIDYIRVYQHSNAINIGCDPQDFPTENYINAYDYHAYLFHS
jgi:hypothetical protein